MKKRKRLLKGSKILQLKDVNTNRSEDDEIEDMIEEDENNQRVLTASPDSGVCRD